MKMKTVFIVNPKAGTRFDETINLIKKSGVEYYITKSPKDAKEYVKKYLTENGEARFIACGGDGTYNEVLNGIIESGCGSMGIMPVGSGNDFCRNFGDKESFLDIKKQTEAEEVFCDAIKYTLTYKGEVTEGYCANMINIGFDCVVADTTNTVREKTFLSGSMAYFVSIFINLVKKTPSYFYIETDGKERYNGEVLLTSLANGCYCGGGLKTNPLAKVNDGFINVNIVKNIPRLKFLTVLPEYIKGTYIGKEKFKSIVTSEKVKSVKIIPKNKSMRISVDGEIMDADTIKVEVLHNAYKFANAKVKAKEEMYI